MNFTIFVMCHNIACSIPIEWGKVKSSHAPFQSMGVPTIVGLHQMQSYICEPNLHMWDVNHAIGGCRSFGGYISIYMCIQTGLEGDWWCKMALLFDLQLELIWVLRLRSPEGIASVFKKYSQLWKRLPTIVGRGIITMGWRCWPAVLASSGQGSICQLTACLAGRIRGESRL